MMIRLISCFVFFVSIIYFGIIYFYIGNSNDYSNSINVSIRSSGGSNSDQKQMLLSSSDNKPIQRLVITKSIKNNSARNEQMPNNRISIVVTPVKQSQQQSQQQQQQKQQQKQEQKQQLQQPSLQPSQVQSQVQQQSQLQPKQQQQQTQPQQQQQQPKQQQNEPKPKPSFDAEDLNVTKSMKIDKPDMCDNDFGITRDLVVIVTSAVPNFDARKAIRQTWGKFAVERGAPLFFIIGDTTDAELQAKVNAEDEINEDILQGSFIDNYYNLTLKTITMMRLASERCNKVKYLLKVDDDVIVNMQQVVDFCETKTFSKSIIGKLAKKWKPHRDLRNKWYVPRSAYKGKMFPYFATGPAYLISGDALRPLYEMSIKLTPIYLEDVYMTGIVAERASIRRLNHALMRNIPVKVNACTFRKLMTSHKHKPADIIKLWDLVYNEPNSPCNTTKN